MDPIKVDPMSSLQKSIRDKKRKHRQLVLKRLLIVLLFSLTLISVVVFVVWYDQSEYSKIQAINVYQQNFVSKEEVIEDLDLEIGQRIYTFAPSSIAKRVDPDSLVESVEVKRRLFEQQVDILVHEKQIIAYSDLNDQQFMVYAIDGSTKVFDNNRKDLKSDLIYLNVNDSELAILVIQALASMDSTILKNVSEATIAPVSYDAQLLQLTLSGGYYLYSALSEIEIFQASHYQEIINQLQSDPDLKCLELDKLSRTVRAYRCPFQEFPETPAGETPAE